MRAYEFIKPLMEDDSGSIADSVEKTLPATYIMPELQNQNPYHQYRFGVAIAGAKGRKSREEDNVEALAPTSKFGEDMTIVSYGEDMGEFIDDALKELGLSKKIEIGTPESEEESDVETTSLLKAFKGFSESKKR
jgi:hypothetical protein